MKKGCPDRKKGKRPHTATKSHTTEKKAGKNTLKEGRSFQRTIPKFLQVWG
ncbi:hypothetical protein LptCag_0004 [Leptospirillum ferriphilum]|uniref:Uncharacterized protein n=1 Tax=Leptospirillum ferriphilum TaxID=178606 RepID=A0A094WAA2_9BACT|nr:hypothetical protein LptCag_0004 [Leptospirillum ferriphilum]